MADDQQAKDQSAMPTDEPQQTNSQDASQQTGEAPKEEVSSDQSQRTAEQFDKLKGHNQELADRVKQQEEILTEYRNRFFGTEQQQPNQQTDQKLDPIYDPNTGYVNYDNLNKVQDKILSAEERAKKAEQRAEQLEKGFNTYLDTTDKQTAYEAYPELDPNSEKHDKTLAQVSRALQMDSMVYQDQYGGKPLTMKQAAELAKKQIKAEEKAEEKAEKKAEEEDSEAKEQASLGTTGRPTQGVQKDLSATQDEELRARTRLGDRDAMIQRMRNIRATSQSQE